MGLNILNTKKTTLTGVENSIVNKKNTIERKQKIFLKDLKFKRASKQDVEEFRIQSYEFVL